MTRSVIVEFAVAKRDCPEGEWEPVVHRRTHKSGVELVWAVSVWPELSFGKNVSGLPLGRLDDSTPGSWIAPPDCDVIAGPGDRIVAEKTESGEVVTVRLVRITG